MNDNAEHRSVVPEQGDQTEANWTAGAEEREVSIEPNAIRLDMGKLVTEDLPAVMSKVVQYAKAFGDIQGAIGPESELVLQIPRHIQQGLADGSLQLLRKKDGTKLAEVVKKVGNRQQFAGKMEVSEALKTNHAAVDGLGADLYNLAIQQQMTALIGEVRSMRTVVDRIEAGQDSDRFAKIKSAENMLRLAVKTEDPESRRQLTIAAIGKLTEGSEQVAGVLRHHLQGMDPVPADELGKYFAMIMERGYVDKKDAEFDKAQDYFALLEKAWDLMAFSVIALDERQLLPDVFDFAQNTTRGLPLDALRSVQRLHPRLRESFKGEWFMRPEGYIEDSKRDYGHLAESSQRYIEVEITGKMLMEAMDDDQDGGRDDQGAGEGQPVQEG